MNRALSIYEILIKEFSEPKCFLDHNNNFELLCAVMLSAQTTDLRVNKVTKVLFAKYKTPSDLASANISDVIEIIRPLGLAKTKANNLVNLAKDLVEKFNSIVPDNKKDLESLAGVGNKTSNVVLAVGFKIPSIAVDTHVYRVSYRLGFRDRDDSLIDCENKLKNIFPKSLWIDVHHLLILFGRTYCKAINPRCSECILEKYCIRGYYENKN